MEESRFTEPEMEAALQLIQLSGESECGEKPMKKPRNEKQDHDESQGSSTSDITSVPRRFIVPRFVADDDDDDNENDVSGSRRRKRKKFRSIIEIYKITKLK